MRADERALVALDALLSVPLRNCNGYAALLVSSCAGRECTVFDALECARRKIVALLSVHRYEDVLDELRKIFLLCLSVNSVSPVSRYLYEVSRIETCVYSLVVHVDYLFTLQSVCLDDGLLEVFCCFVYRDNVREFEECGLHDHVDTVAESDLTSDLCSVQCVELDVVLSDVLLHCCRKVLVELFVRPDAVQQECAALLQALEYVILMYICLVVASYEVSLVDEVCRLDLVLSESQVGYCDTAGLLGVIGEVTLCIEICFVTDDLDGLLVSANSTVGTESPELASYCAFRLSCDVDCLERAAVNIINDTDREVILRLVLLDVLIYSNDLSRCRVVRTKTISSCIDLRSVLDVEVHVSDIEVERIAFSARLFCSVKYSYLLNCLRHYCEEVFARPRSVKSYLQEADLLAFFHENVDRLFDSLADGTHSNDDVLSVSSSDIVEQLVVSSCELADLAHVLFNYSRYVIVERLSCFTSLEEDIRVLSCTAYYRVLRIESSCSEFVDCVHVDQFADLFVIDDFDLLDLMRCSESIEEVQERNSALDSRKVSYAAEVHNFLNGAGAQQCESCLTAGHNVRVVAEDTKSVSSKCSSRYVEYARKELACDLVHVRDHQKKTLRSCVCRCERACLQRSVYSTCCACFGLHLYHFDFLSENVLVAMRSHIIDDLCHR